MLKCNRTPILVTLAGAMSMSYSCSRTQNEDRRPEAASEAVKKDARAADEVSRVTRLPAPVKKGRYFGYERHDASKATGKVWASITHFHPSGYAAVNDDKRWLLIDRNEDVIGELYEVENYPDSIQDEMVRLAQGDKTRFFSVATGKIIPGEWDYGSPFANGSACVCNQCKTEKGEHFKVQGGEAWMIARDGTKKVELADVKARCDTHHHADTREWKIFYGSQLPRELKG